MTPLETSRVALIEFEADGKSRVGSGLLVNDHAVLTADHVAQGSGHKVTLDGNTHQVGELVRSESAAVDLAIMILEPAVKGVARLGYALIGTSGIAEVPGCFAVGYPKWSAVDGVRNTAQVPGKILTADHVGAGQSAASPAGLRTLLGEREPAHPIPQGDLTDSPWGGMSGAVITTADRKVVGVVRSINLASDRKSLTFTPLNAIDGLADGQRQRFWRELGADPRRLRMLPEQPQRPEPAGYQYDLCISHYQDGRIDGWVREIFMEDFRRALNERRAGQERLSMVCAADVADVVRSSRVLLAVISRGYFDSERCRSSFGSMIQRQVKEGYRSPDKPESLVHSIVAHDFGERNRAPVPEEFIGQFLPVNFKDWAIDLRINNYDEKRKYLDALDELADQVSDAIDVAPEWRNDFPRWRSGPITPQTARKPTL